MGDLDVMAVILDATQAYQKNSNIWTMRIKLIDHTMQEPVTLLMFAFTPKELPKINTLGDILYIKNAKLDSYMGKKNIVWNARAQTTWSLFSGKRSKTSYQLPSLFSKDVPDIQENEFRALQFKKRGKPIPELVTEEMKTFLVKLRDWSLAYLKSVCVLDPYQILPNSREKQD